MRTLITVLLAATLATKTVATTTDEYTFVAPVDAICTTGQILADTMSRYGEMPIMLGQSLRNVQGVTVAMPTVLFMNRDTGSWTLAEQLSADVYCVVAMGQNWQTYEPDAPATKT